jgi:hypothetical protein
LIGAAFLLAMVSPKILELLVSSCHAWRFLTDCPLFIDIHVPPDQVIDTVDLYFLRERQRRLSLRFLSWFVLHENIQTDTHDSIEDARSALMLYKAFQDFEERGVFDEKLDELYREGRKHVGFPTHDSYSHHSHHAELETASPGEDGDRVTCGASYSGCFTTECAPYHAKSHDTCSLRPEWFPGWCLCRISAERLIES